MFDPRQEGLNLDSDATARSESVAVRRSRRVMTAETLAARKAADIEAGILRVRTAVGETVPSAPPEDPGAFSRHTRLGVCAALVLVLVLIWCLQKRKREGK